MLKFVSVKFDSETAGKAILMSHKFCLEHYGIPTKNLVEHLKHHLVQEVTNPSHD